MKRTEPTQRPVIILKDTNDYDTRGRRVSYSVREEKEKESDVIEPFDPAYLVEEEDKNPYKLERGEKTVCRMTAILQKQLLKAGIRPIWNGGSFEFSKESHGIEITRYAWIDSEDNTYCYGTGGKCLIYGKNVSEIIDMAKKFMEL